jgi:hypothetical protein
MHSEPTIVLDELFKTPTDLIDGRNQFAANPCIIVALRKF